MAVGIRVKLTGVTPSSSTNDRPFPVHEYLA